MTTTLAAGERVRDGLGLVRVELGDAAAREGRHQARIDALGNRRQPGLGLRHPADGSNDLVGRIGAVPGPGGDQLVHGSLQGLLARDGALLAQREPVVPGLAFDVFTARGSGHGGGWYQWVMYRSRGERRMEDKRRLWALGSRRCRAPEQADG